MKRLFALGLVLAGLLAVPSAARAWNGNAPAPSVLGVNFHGGPSVLGVRSGFAAPGHIQRPHVLAGGGRRLIIVAPPAAVVVQPAWVWVEPAWAWNGWEWVWVPGYWAW